LLALYNSHVSCSLVLSLQQICICSKKGASMMLMVGFGFEL